MYNHSILLTEAQIQSRIAELATVLNRDYQGDTLDVVCVLKGALLFAADLMRHLEILVKLHFVQTGSYGTGTESSGTLDYREFGRNLRYVGVLAADKHEK